MTTKSLAWASLVAFGGACPSAFGLGFAAGRALWIKEHPTCLRFIAARLPSRAAQPVPPAEAVRTAADQILCMIDHHNITSQSPMQPCFRFLSRSTATRSCLSSFRARGTKPGLHSNSQVQDPPKRPLTACALTVVPNVQSTQGNDLIFMIKWPLIIIAEA